MCRWPGQRTAAQGRQEAALQGPSKQRLWDCQWLWCSDCLNELSRSLPVVARRFAPHTCRQSSRCAAHLQADFQVCRTIPHLVLLAVAFGAQAVSLSPCKRGNAHGQHAAPLTLQHGGTTVEAENCTAYKWHCCYAAGCAYHHCSAVNNSVHHMCCHARIT